MSNTKKSRTVKSIILFFLVVDIFLVLGCNLTTFEIWSASRDILEDEEREMVVNTVAAINQEATERAKPPVNEEALEPNSALEYAWEFGVRCIDAPGEDPCPLEACFTASDQYSVVLEKTTELFGKDNPDNYSCGADYRFTNHSGADLLIWHNVVDHEGDMITISSIKIATDEIYEEYHYNYFDRHDGVITYRIIPKIYVLYDNPHCAWIEYGKPEVEKLSIDLMNPCGK
jgi:hypothetical protein